MIKSNVQHDSTIQQEIVKMGQEKTEPQTRKNRGKIKISKFQIFAEKTGVYLIALLLIIIGGIYSDQFLTAENFLNITRNAALLGIVVAGASFVTYVGHYADLSIPAIIPLSGIVSVTLLPYGIYVAIIGGILAGTLIGVMNGYVVGYLKANPILWTLAVAFFMEGLMRFAMSNNQIYPDSSPGTSGESFVALYRSSFLGIPIYVIAMFLMIIASAYIYKKTRFGKEVKLVGSSYDVAEGSGINTRKTVFYSFLFTAFSASVAGIFITSFNKTGVYYLGQGYDFQAVTAIVLGGMTLSGGRGNIIGVLGGVFVIGLLANLMTFIGIHPFQQNIVIGTIFIFVVGLNQYQLRKMGRDHG
jgi:ribose/xylose/arabinose/galactoside ABC-type transport system permease subunit